MKWLRSLRSRRDHLTTPDVCGQLAELQREFDGFIVTANQGIDASNHNLDLWDRQRLEQRDQITELNRKVDLLLRECPKDYRELAERIDDLTRRFERSNTEMDERIDREATRRWEGDNDLAKGQSEIDRRADALNFLAAQDRAKLDALDSFVREPISEAEAVGNLIADLRTVADTLERSQPFEVSSDDIRSGRVELAMDEESNRVILAEIERLEADVDPEGETGEFPASPCPAPPGRCGDCTCSPDPVAEVNEGKAKTIPPTPPIAPVTGGSHWWFQPALVPPLIVLPVVPPFDPFRVTCQTEPAV